MVTYVVGGGEGGPEHQIDHPPLFACREHKNLLKFSARFVDELLATSQDVMPGNPDEIAQAFLQAAAPAYRLPEFLIPPKLVLFNPRGLRGAEALPYAIVLIDRKFFGLPARYLTPDRFDGCDECAEELANRRPPSSQQPRPAPPGARPPGPPVGGTNTSGVRRMPTPPPGLNDSAARRAPDPGSGIRRGPPPAPRKGPPGPRPPAP